MHLESDCSLVAVREGFKRKRFALQPPGPKV